MPGIITFAIALIIVVVVVLIVRALLPYLGLPEGVNTAILLLVGLVAFLFLLTALGVPVPLGRLGG